MFLENVLEKAPLNTKSLKSRIPDSSTHLRLNAKHC